MSCVCSIYKVASLTLCTNDRDKLSKKFDMRDGQYHLFNQKRWDFDCGFGGYPISPI